MKKALVILLAAVVLVSCLFAACTKKDNTDSKTSSDSTANGIADNAEEYSLDKNGNVVTDKDGNAVTIAKTESTTQTTQKSDSKDKKNPTTVKPTTTQAPEKTTGTTKKNVPNTSSSGTTKATNNEIPDTDDDGKQVNFSAADQERIKSMLEVPYLYEQSYENTDGVPIEIANHVAVWMAEREGETREIYPSSPVVLNLFKYFGQTVVNYKTQCNNYNADKKDTGAPITYIKNDDTFKISGFTAKAQTVSITKIEDMGGNNYYKVTAKVKNCPKKKVVAVIQKNGLDASLGFSIKALKWS